MSAGPLTALRWTVVRTLSSVSAKKTTWKVMSRPLHTPEIADQWMDYCKSMEKNPKHEFFVVCQDMSEEMAEALSQGYLLESQINAIREEQALSAGVGKWYENFRKARFGAKT